MSWLVRHCGGKIGHFIDGYRSSESRYQCLSGPDHLSSTFVSPSYRNRLPFRNPYPCCWFLEPTDYRGLYHAIFREHDEDSRRSANQQLVVIQESDFTNDYPIMALLRREHLVLKHVDSYRRYGDFSEDCFCLLNDTLAAYETSPALVSARLGESGFNVH